MNARIAPARLHELGWRIVRDDAAVHLRTGSFGDGVALAGDIGTIAEGAQRGPRVDLRPDGVTVRLPSDREGRFGEDQIELARRISAAAAARGASADPGHLQSVQIAIDALVIPDVLPFWQAVLAYDQVGDEDLEDPRHMGPPVWFQQMDERRPQRNRFHVDVYVPADQAEARVAAALAAGGHIVNDEHAPGWWTLADAEGNEVDVAAWPDLD